MKIIPALLSLLTVILLGGVAVGVVNALVGIRFEDVGWFAELAHKVAYMAWGAIIANVVRRFIVEL